MLHYRFKFKILNSKLRASGNGTCTGDSYAQARTTAKEGVAKDFGYEDSDNVLIVSMTEYTPRKKEK